MTDAALHSHVRWAHPGDAAAVAARIAEEVRRPGAKRIAVPGGSTPAAVFARLAAEQLDWRGTTVTLTDDRQVAEDHPASNFGALKRALGATGATIEPLAEQAHPQPFDLVWLGMGADGHVASLFPHMAAADVPHPAVIATVPEPLPPEAPFARLSLNLPALTAAKEVIVVVTGAAKRLVIARAIAGEGNEPIRQVLSSARGPVTIYWSEA